MLNIEASSYTGQQLFPSRWLRYAACSFHLRNTMCTLCRNFALVFTPFRRYVKMSNVYCTSGDSFAAGKVIKAPTYAAPPDSDEEYVPHEPREERVC
jgi:hypothetical protein